MTMVNVILSTPTRDYLAQNNDANGVWFTHEAVPGCLLIG